MREPEKNGKLSVHATAGSNAVLLGFNVETSDGKAPKDLVGFAIERVDHGKNNQKCLLQGKLTFEETSSSAKGYPDDHCIQGFLWVIIRLVRTARHKYDTVRPLQLYLTPNNSWAEKYYTPGTIEEKQRLYFAGKSPSTSQIKTDPQLV